MGNNNGCISNIADHRNVQYTCGLQELRHTKQNSERQHYPYSPVEATSLAYDYVKNETNHTFEQVPQDFSEKLPVRGLNIKSAPSKFKKMHNAISEKEPSPPRAYNEEKTDRIFESNGILESCCMTKTERANANAPDISYLRRNYITCEKYCDDFDWSYIRDHHNIVGLSISTILDDYMDVADEINVTLKNHKYLFRAKIKRDASKTSTRAKGATNAIMSHAEAQKKIAKLLTTRTIIASFDPAKHMHLLNIVHYRLIDVRMLYYKDLELGLKTDRESLIRRHLGKDWLERPDAFSAIALVQRFFGSSNWKRNVNDKTNLPIVHMNLAGAREIDEASKSTSRQELIKQEHALLAWTYRDRYTQAYLLGRYVVRIHVKKLEQLREVNNVVERLPDLLQKEMERKGTPKKNYDFILISLPKSTQATRLRGFFMYLQYRSQDLAREAQRIFQDPEKNGAKVKYKCEAAVPKKK